ncbi:hypothetical protein Anapl_10307 [Anas platyrhynchos]|uniref:Uncharacterized protein n=1 Tax=Anas platyrhynchos TaxID=8839 RepID=R0JQ59_ANAPL|nr:hypothetical protein Anapl_10307 [Anas platyrhynchos]
MVFDHLPWQFRLYHTLIHAQTQQQDRSWTVRGFEEKLFERPVRVSSNERTFAEVKIQSANTVMKSGTSASQVWRTTLGKKLHSITQELFGSGTAVVIIPRRSKGNTSLLYFLTDHVEAIQNQVSKRNAEKNYQMLQPVPPFTPLLAFGKETQAFREFNKKQRADFVHNNLILHQQYNPKVSSKRWCLLNFEDRGNYSFPQKSWSKEGEYTTTTRAAMCRQSHLNAQPPPSPLWLVPTQASSATGLAVKSLEERFNLHFQFTGGHKNKTKKGLDSNSINTEISLKLSKPMLLPGEQKDRASMEVL